MERLREEFKIMKELMIALKDGIMEGLINVFVIGLEISKYI